LITPRRDALRGLSERNVRAVKRTLSIRRSRLEVAAGTMTALSPLATLGRGYAVPLAKSGRVLRRTGDFSDGVEFSLRVVDGHVECRASGSAAIDEAGA